jgi:hypothetical protein
MAVVNELSKVLANKTVKNALLAVGGFFLFNYLKKGENRTEVLNTNPSDESTRLALALYDAFHPYVNLPFGFPDGTNEEAVKSSALEIGRLNLYTKVVDKFKLIYNQDLLSELQSEGVYDQFISQYNLGLNRTTSGGTGGVKTVRHFYKVGDKVTAKSNYFLRNIVEPFTPLRKTVFGEKLVITQIRINKKIDGKLGTWLVVDEDKFFNNTYLLSIDGVNPIL